MDKQILLRVIIIFGVMAIAVYVTIILKNKKIALKGYDLVAYFEINQAIKGHRKFLYKYNNKTYYFVCEAHKQSFIQNPAKYVPQYNGYCAYGMSKGYKEKTNPEAFTVFYDKLYLNFNFKYRDFWLKNRDERILTANENWEKFKNSNE